MHLTLAAIAKNEGPYIAEWLAHHSLLGFDQIIVMDNQSTDSMAEVLEVCRRSMAVVSEVWETKPGVSPQMSCYNHVLKTFGPTTDAIAFIDIDEFLITTGDLNFRQVLERCFADVECGAVVVNQRVFGSNGHETKGSEPVLTRFPMGSNTNYLENEWVKTIYRTAAVEKITNCHSSPLMNGQHFHPSGKRAKFKEGRYATEDVDHGALQLNHYITKSFEEFLEKRQRGGGMASSLEERKARYVDDGFFRNRQYATNVERDPSTSRAAEKMLARLQEFGAT